MQFEKVIAQIPRIPVHKTLTCKNALQTKKADSLKGEIVT
jgi:hypothetical protein